MSPHLVVLIYSTQDN